MERRIIYRDRIDHKILFIIVSLIAFGLVMIYSVATAQENLIMFYKQVVSMVLGFAIAFFFRRMKMDYLLFKVAIWVYISSYFFILALLAPPPITVTVNGATRWLKIVFFRFQVAEYVKLAVILVLAAWIEYTRYRRGVKEEILFILGAWAMGFIPAGLLMVISNDLSSSLVVLGITFIMTFVASRGWTGVILHVLFMLAAVAVAGGFVYYVATHIPSPPQDSEEVPFRFLRIAAWLHPEQYSNTIAYQSVHCLYAIANGGWFGKGLGQSWQKASLPESENDVIFAIIIEELGIFGGIVLLFLFLVLVTLICKVAFNQKNLFSKMMCVGIASHIMLQVIVHCGVCTNLIPNTGIGLPFISSGMTSALLLMGEMAIVLSAANVHIFDLYDRKLQRARRIKKENEQKYFMGRKVRQQEARVAAMNRAAEIGSTPNVEGEVPASRRKSNEVLRNGGSRRRVYTPSGGSRSGTGVSSSSGRVSNTSRTSSSGRTSSTARGSSAGRNSSTGRGSNAGRNSSTGRGSNADRNRGTTGRNSTAGNDHRTSSRPQSIQDYRSRGYGGNRRKAPTSIYSWKYDEERKGASGKKPNGGTARGTNSNSRTPGNDRRR